MIAFDPDTLIFKPIILNGSDEAIKKFFINYYQLIWQLKFTKTVTLSEVELEQQAISLFDESASYLYIINKTAGKFLNEFKDFYIRNGFKHPIIILTNSSKSEFIKFAKSNKNCTVTDCYSLYPHTFASILKNLLTLYHLNLEPDAMRYLGEIACLNPDPLICELNKLSLYFNNESTKITLPDIQRICQFTAQTQLDQAIHGLMARNVSMLDQAIPLSLLEDDQFLILRVFMKCFQQMLDLHSRLRVTPNIDQCIPQVTPFIFFNQKRLFIRYIKDWSPMQCLQQLNWLNNLEYDLKHNSLTPSEIKSTLLMLVI